MYGHFETCHRRASHTMFFPSPSEHFKTIWEELLLLKLSFLSPSLVKIKIPIPCFKLSGAWTIHQTDLHTETQIYHSQLLKRIQMQLSTPFLFSSYISETLLALRADLTLPLRIYPVDNMGVHRTSLRALEVKETNDGGVSETLLSLGEWRH
jgi:hypothetical protein